MRLNAGLVLIMMVALTGCDSNPTNPSSGVPFTVTDIIVGDGAEATNGRTLLVDFTGWLYDANAPDNRGAVFDTTAGRQPFSFVLGMLESGGSVAVSIWHVVLPLIPVVLGLAMVLLAPRKEVGS